MKRWIVITTLALLATLLLVAPAVALTTHNDWVAGIEVDAGDIQGDTRFGATFVGTACGDLPGVVKVSINYTPPNPGPSVTNRIVGGDWSLKVYRWGKYLGKLYGPVSGGQAVWNADGSKAEAVVLLTIEGGERAYAGKTGSGSFTGVLSHKTFPPTWYGQLQLAY